MYMLTSLIILIVLIIAGIFLQIFLSGRENKWLGLILPLISFAFSLIVVLGIITYDGIRHHHPGMGIRIFFTILYTLFISNIPTYILLGIYFAVREKRKKRKELEKMSIQDLES